MYLISQSPSNNSVHLQGRGDLVKFKLRTRTVIWVNVVGWCLRNCWSGGILPHRHTSQRWSEKEEISSAVALWEKRSCDVKGQSTTASMPLLSAKTRMLQVSNLRLCVIPPWYPHDLNTMRILGASGEAKCTCTDVCALWVTPSDFN